MTTSYTLEVMIPHFNREVEVRIAYAPSHAKKFVVLTIAEGRAPERATHYTLTDAVRDRDDRLADLNDAGRRAGSVAKVVAPSFADPTAQQREIARRSNDGY